MFLIAVVEGIRTHEGTPGAVANRTTECSLRLKHTRHSRQSSCSPPFNTFDARSRHQHSYAAIYEDKHANNVCLPLALKYLRPQPPGWKYLDRTIESLAPKRVVPPVPLVHKTSFFVPHQCFHPVVTLSSGNMLWERALSALPRQEPRTHIGRKTGEERGAHG
ncbi:unnamed protein product [Ectocarpus sp. 4 AP-2014]